MEPVEGGAPQGGRAFEDLLSANLDALHRTAVRLCGNPDDAEDVLQDAVVRAFQHRGELRDPDAGRAWLFRILVRTHLNRLRGESRRREEAESDMSEERFEAALAEWSREQASGDWLERLDDRERVRRAVVGIDARFRAVLQLCDVEQFSQREVAAMLEIPEGTVASRLYRARRELREILTRDSEVSSRRVI